MATQYNRAFVSFVVDGVSVNEMGRDILTSFEPLTERGGTVQGIDSATLYANTGSAGTITLTLREASATNDQLTDILKSQDNGTFTPFDMSGLSGFNRKSLYKECVVKQEPSKTTGEAGPDFVDWAWVIGVKTTSFEKII